MIYLIRISLINRARALLVPRVQENFLQLFNAGFQIKTGQFSMIFPQRVNRQTFRAERRGHFE